MTLGSTIRKYREESKFSMKQLGDYIGWTSPSVSDLERDKKSPPDFSTLTKISEFLKIDKDILLKKATEATKTIKFDLTTMTPKRRELLLCIYHNWESVTEDDAKSLLKFFRIVED